MLIDLTAEQVDLLATITQKKLADLEIEIRHTSTRDFRDYLKDQHRNLGQLLDHLHATQPVMAGDRE